MRQTKELINGPDKEITDRLFQVSRDDMRLAVGLLTDHCYLSKHMHILGTGKAIVFRKYEEDDERPILVIRHCPAMAARRMRYLGTPMLEPGVVSDSRRLDC